MFEDIELYSYYIRKIILQLIYNYYKLYFSLVSLS